MGCPASWSAHHSLFSTFFFVFLLFSFPFIHDSTAQEKRAEEGQAEKLLSRVTKPSSFGWDLPKKREAIKKNCGRIGKFY